MNDQDPQTAIDYNLYPSSASPSGLQVPQPELKAELPSVEHVQDIYRIYDLLEEVANLKAELAAFHAAMQRERKPDWEKWHMDLADIVDSISSTDEVASIKTPVSQLDVPGTLKAAARELRSMAASFTHKANFVPSDLEIKALKEQVGSLEKQVAAIRDVLSRWEHYMPPTEPYNWSETFSTDFLKKVKAALSTTAGRNYFKVCPKCAYESDK